MTMAARAIASRMAGVYARGLLGRGTSGSLSAVPAACRRHRTSTQQNYSAAPTRRCLSTVSVDNATTVTELLRQCAEEQRGFDSVLPLKSLLFSLRSQNALTWSADDLVNLAVGLCHTAPSYDKTAVWQALAPLIAAVADKLEVEQLSKLMWSLQSLPNDLSDDKSVTRLLASVNAAMRNTPADDWREDQLAQAAYCVPALDTRSSVVKVLLRTLKSRLRDVKPGDGVDAAFVAMHLQQSMDVAGREVVDLYAALLEKCTTIRGTAPHSVPRELLRNRPQAPVSRSEVRKQWSQLNQVDAGLSILSLYGFQDLDVLRGTNSELTYVLYEALGSKRRQSALPMPVEPTLTGESKEMHNVLRRLYENIGQTNTAPSVARALGTSLYGLQQLSGDVKHVRQLLSVSAQQLTDSTTDLYVQALQRSLYSQQPQQSPATTATTAATTVAAAVSKRTKAAASSSTKLSKAAAAASPADASPSSSRKRSNT